MKIKALHLQAFGPFTEKTLDFSEEQGHLHVVYGPNEAGKSSSLRALKALLYGISARTKDNFIHNNRSLRIGGTLLSQSGELLPIVRRKGNKDTLLSPDGSTLDEAILRPYLNGLSSEIFDTLFGIDYQSLVQGGEEILEQKGEVGQALFSASTGSANLHRVLLELEKEAEALFKPNGSAPVVNSAIKSHSEIQKAIREHSLSSIHWDEARESLESASAQLEKTQAEVHELKRQRTRLQRIERSVPRLVERKRALEDIQRLGNVTVLTDSFDTRRQEADNTLEGALAAANTATSRAAGLEDEIGAICVNEALLEKQELLQNLHSGLGARIKATQDRPHLQAKRDSKLASAELIIRAINPSMTLADAQSLRPVLSRSAEITALAAQQQAITDKVSHFKDIESVINVKYTELSTQLERLPPPIGRLDSAAAQLKTSQKAGDIDAQHQAIDEEVAILTSQCEQGIAALGPVWGGSVEAITSSVWPSIESVAGFEEEFEALANAARRYKEKLAECAERAREAQEKLDEITYVGNIPTEADLQDARGGRDHLWRLLHGKWKNGEDVSAEIRELNVTTPLEQLFESRIEHADELSDRLRREAERVQSHARCLAVIATAKTHAAELEAKEQECDASQQQLTTRWQSLWQPQVAVPLAPAQMRVWLANMNRLKGQVNELNSLKQRAKSLAALQSQHISALTQELSVLNEQLAPTQSLAKAVTEAEIVLDRLIHDAAEHAALIAAISDTEATIAKTTDDLTTAQTKRDSWQVSWSHAVEGMGLGDNPSPSQAMAVLDNIRELFSELKEAGDFGERIDAIDTDDAAYTAKIKALLAQVAPELAELAAEEAITQLMAALSQAGKQDAQLRQLSEQLSAAREEIATSEAIATAMAQCIAALCKEAHCSERAELEPALQRSREYVALRSSLEKLEQELLEIGKGVSLEELELESATVDPDSLPGEIESLRCTIEQEKEPQITVLARDMGVKQNELTLMNGGNTAAMLADEAESVLASVRLAGEQYVQLKLASKILRDEIERYRREHQGPILKQASAHFAKLTLGSFVELRADFDEKDNPVLAGIRSDGEHVYVEGMSSGTRDQLYLALRLASLEKYIDGVEPMPFIVDDILVHFDDARSNETLEILAQLAQRTQIILFTHHSHVVEQAKNIKRGFASIHTL